MIIRVDIEVNVKRTGAVIEGPDNKGLGMFQEWVKITFKNSSAELGRIGVRFNHTVELVCVGPVTFVQHIQHFRESPGRNWLCDTFTPEPILGRRWPHLECTMGYLTVVAILYLEGNLKQVLDLSNRVLDRLFGLAKMSRRCCRIETCTRYVPADKGSLLKALESDIGLFQE